MECGPFLRLALSTIDIIDLAKIAFAVLTRIVGREPLSRHYRTAGPEADRLRLE